MSRAYRIAVKESLSRTVDAADGVNATLELLPVLQKERMAELLARELERRGFTRDGDTASRREEGGVTITIGLTTGEVALVAEGHAELTLETQRVGMVEDPSKLGEGEAQLRLTAREGLEQQAAAEQEALRRKVTQQLEGRLKDVRAELDQVTTRVTAEALKQRAAELGEVESIHEDANGGLTIRVRV